MVQSTYMYLKMMNRKSIKKPVFAFTFLASWHHRVLGGHLGNIYSNTMHHVETKLKPWVLFKNNMKLLGINILILLISGPF